MLLNETLMPQCYNNYPHGWGCILLSMSQPLTLTNPPPPPLRNLMHLFYNHKTTWFSRAIHFDASKWNPCWRILSDYLLLLFLNNSWRFLTALFTSKLVSNKMAFTLSLSLSFLTLLVDKDFPKDWQTNKEPETHHQSKQRILGLLHCFNSAVSSDLKT